ncbi:MAG: hypothetical protein JNL70_18965 [Saprospiraceae bacterium]|nr:hypothetical protein [Saprospiraceae bacterium]
MKYPETEGWLKLSLKLKKGAKVEKEDVLNFCSGNNIQSIEVAEYVETKSSIKVIFRQKEAQQQ